MKSFFLSFSFLLLSPLLCLATDITPPSSSPSPTPTKPAVMAAAATPVIVATPAPSAALVTRELPEIHATMQLPQNWTLLPGKLLEGDVLLATREKIATESDPWTTGLSMTIDRNGAKDSGQKASDYAMGLASEAKEKAGDDASPIKESHSGAFHEIRFDFPVAGDQPLMMTEVLRANDSTGTLTVILWQSSNEEAPKLQDLREQILAGIKLDPAQ